MTQQTGNVTQLFSPPEHSREASLYAGIPTCETCHAPRAGAWMYMTSLGPAHACLRCYRERVDDHPEASEIAQEMQDLSRELEFYHKLRTANLQFGVHDTPQNREKYLRTMHGIIEDQGLDAVMRRIKSEDREVGKRVIEVMGSNIESMVPFAMSHIAGSFGIATDFIARGERHMTLLSLRWRQCIEADEEEALAAMARQSDEAETGVTQKDASATRRAS